VTSEVPLSLTMTSAVSLGMPGSREWKHLGAYHLALLDLTLASHRVVGV
jgi:hypothetical protein